MFAFGCSITAPDLYERYAGPGIELAREPGSVVLPNLAAGRIFRSYNLILDQAAVLDGLEGLVLLHQDARIADGQFLARAREALADPDVAIVGCVGAVGAVGIAWWEGAVTWSTFETAYGGWGGGGSPALADDGRHVAGAPLGEVDTLDGFVLVLSSWAVRHLRFDESLSPLVWGFDFDLCQQARAAGRTVVAADLGVVHERPAPIELVSDAESWTEAYLEVAEKWEGRLPGAGPGEADERRRARRAEAEAGEAKLAAISKMMQSYAQADAHQAGLRRVTETRSWRATRPLRELNLRRRALRAGPGDGAA